MQALATTAAYVGAGTLLFSGYDHARHTSRYRNLIRQQAIWPAGLEGMVVGLVTTLEVALGLAAAALLVAAPSPLLRPVLFAMSGTYLLYGAYGRWLLREHPAAPCGCSTHRHPTNIWVPIRALSLAGLTLAGAVMVDQLMRPVPSLAFVTLLLMSIGLGVPIWILPAAMHDPFRAAPRRRLTSASVS